MLAAIEFFANHPMIIIGSTRFPDVAWGDDRQVSADNRHLRIQTAGELTRVSLWSHVMPLIGEIVYDGPLDIVDYQVCVTEVEDLTRLTRQVERTGTQRVVVCADDPIFATRVHVGFGLGTDVVRLTAAATHPLPAILTSTGTSRLGKVDLILAELDLILADHDSPLARLSAAIKVMAGPAEGRQRSDQFGIKRVVDWLCRPGAGVTYGHAVAFGEEISERLQAYRNSTGTATDNPDHDAVTIATGILQRIAVIA